MNQDELIRKLAADHGLSLALAGRVVAAVFGVDDGVGVHDDGIIATELRAGRPVVIVGFGAFGTRKREAHTARNPGTGAVVNVTAKTHVVWSAGKALRERIGAVA